jgi:glycosyltransferase involved in cell wall biosynthesis
MATQKQAPLLRRPRRILVVADPNSPLTRERGLVGQTSGHDIYWYSLSKVELEGVAGAIAPPRVPVLFIHILSPLYLSQAIGCFQPDLIHAHCAYQNWNTLVLVRFKPLVVTEMGGDILPDQGFRGIRHVWFTKKLLDHADIITSKSSFLDGALNRIGNYAHKIRRVTWGVDIYQFRPGLDVSYLREQREIEPDDFVLFCPRICQPFYNKHLIIQAFAKYVRETESRAKLLIAELFADEAYRRQLGELVKELNLTRYVRFVGSVPPREMPAYCNLAHVVISMPPSDGMPQSLYEAMACGAYPILGKLPQYQELVQDGVNGRLVPVGDVSALAEAMKWTAVNLEHRREVARINRERVVEIANKATQDRLVNEIYCELLEKYAR